LRFARELEEGRAAQEGSKFTDVEEANRLVESDPNAFLLAALFTQGIPAEKAWAGPYLLARRLGEGPDTRPPVRIDIGRLAEMDFEKLAAVFARKPVLHRYKRQMVRYIQSAARRILQEYEGDASNIWNDRPTARQLQERLVAFDGIGQKKAAMIVEILGRHFRVRIGEQSGTDVAADVHVRRVMYRTGISPSEEAETVVDSARLACPERPGLLDLACWLIGRHWCHPRNPDHDACRLCGVCPRIGTH